MTETPSTTSYPPPGSPPPRPPPPLPPVSPPLFRSRTDRKVAGVCGGGGRRFGIDPLILRVVVVVLAVFGGSGIVLYALGWLLIPDEGADRSIAQRAVDQNGRRGDRSGFATVVIGVLAGIAVLLLLGGLVAGLGLNQDGYSLDVWPLVVIGGIAAAVWYSSRPDSGSTPASPATPGATPYGPYAAYATPYAAPTTTPQVVQPPKPRRPRSVLGPVTLSLAAMAAGVMALIDRTGAAHVTSTVFLAVLLAVVGLGLVVGAFVGRGRGLIVWGVLLALLTAGSAAASQVDLHQTGDVTWRPATAASVPVDGYTWGAGDVSLDLTSLPTGMDPVRVSAQLGVGTLTVTVPADAWVRVVGHVGVGTIRLPAGQVSDGLARSAEATFGGDLVSPNHDLILDLTVGAGTLEVHRASS